MQRIGCIVVYQLTCFVNVLHLQIHIPLDVFLTFFCTKYCGI